MRRIALTIALASLAATLSPHAAPRRARDCPTVQVSCPDTVMSGTPVTFTATVLTADASLKPTYTWVASGGTIQSGQGTGSIVVDTTGLWNFSLTAAVDVTGLPESCPSSASCTTIVIREVYFHDELDEYGNIRWEDERARLDNFAIELQNWPEGVGYVMAYGGRVSVRGEARRRAERARRYLTDFRGIPAGRVVAVDGGYKGNLTVELRMRSKDVEPPSPSPTVDPSEVRFVKPVRKRTARRGAARRAVPAGR